MGDVTRERGAHLDILFMGPEFLVRLLLPTEKNDMCIYRHFCGVCHIQTGIDMKAGSLIMINAKIFRHGLSMLMKWKSSNLPEQCRV